MEPLDTFGFGEVDCAVNKLSADAVPLEIWMESRVEQKRMFASIPRDVDKADENIMGHRTYMSKIVR